MKKLLFLLTLTLFCGTALIAAPQNTRQGGGLSTNKRVSSTKASSNRATTNRANTRATTRTGSKATGNRATTNRANQRAAQTRATAQERKEARNQEFGLMPSELDSTNHNVFHADASAIKGARDTESALRYLPFVTIINTAGFGSQFDLRGQGRLSSNGVKLYINGVPANPVDSYYNPMPIATLIPSLIDEVSVTPGGGAIRYGSGAKGGTIDIVTSKRTAPYFLVGAGYVNTMATTGSSYNAFARAAENFGPHIKANAGLAFQQMGGPREDDSQTLGQAVLGGWYDIGWGQSVSANLDVFYGKDKTSPYASLIDEDALTTATRNNKLQQAAGGIEHNRHLAVSQIEPFSPDKSSRADKGNGVIESTTIRATGDVAWNSQLTERLNLNVKGIYSLFERKYDKYELELPYFVLGFEDPTNSTNKGYRWYLPRLNSNQATGNVNDNIIIWSGDGHRTDWHFLDQSGTSTKDYKFGGQAEVKWKHDKGEFLFGLSLLYEMSNRNSKSHLRQAIIDNFDSQDGSATGGTRLALRADIDNKIDMGVITTSAYAFDRYDFNRNFSLGAGFRYEMKNYNFKANDIYDIGTIQFNTIGGNWQYQQGNFKDTNFEEYRDGAQIIELVEKESSQNYDNFTFELAPVFKYSNSGSIYARGELGYIAPPVWAMMRRVGVINQGDPNSKDTLGLTSVDFDYKPTELKNETYYTAELGWKELIGSRRVPLLITNLDLNALLFSVSAFYTASQNEFYFSGDTWSGLHYGNYSQSRRMGAEIALEQYLFGGALGLNESFTYIKAQKMDCAHAEPMSQNPLTNECVLGKEWQTIPYTYDFKATFGANVNISTFLEVIDVDVSVWLQNSLYGNQYIPITNVGLTPLVNQSYDFYTNDGGYEKLKPYLISDFGVSVGINKNMGVVTVGVKNVFDTFYYDYYNNDKSAVVNENRYVIGRGRTVFVEGTFRY